MSTSIAQLAYLESLNSFLATRSYVTGYAPTQDDTIAFAAVRAKPNQDQFPNAARWYKHIAYFTEAVRAAWPPGQGSVTITTEATKLPEKLSTPEPKGHPPHGQTSSSLFVWDLAPTRVSDLGLREEEEEEFTPSSRSTQRTATRVPGEPDALEKFQLEEALRFSSLNQGSVTVATEATKLPEKISTPEPKGQPPHGPTFYAEETLTAQPASGTRPGPREEEEVLTPSSRSIQRTAKAPGEPDALEEASRLSLLNQGKATKSPDDFFTPEPNGLPPHGRISFVNETLAAQPTSGTRLGPRQEEEEDALRFSSPNQGSVTAEAIKPAPPSTSSDSWGQVTEPIAFLPVATIGTDEDEEDRARKVETDLPFDLNVMGISFRYLKVLQPNANDSFQETHALFRQLAGPSRNLAVHLYCNPETREYASEVADVFLSFAWEGTFGATMAAFESKLPAGNDIFVWMDAAMMNHAPLDPIDYRESVLSLLTQIPRSLIVVHVPFPFGQGNVGCCLDWYMMISHNFPYEICVVPEDEQQFIHDILADDLNVEEFNQIFSTFDFGDSSLCEQKSQFFSLTPMPGWKVTQVSQTLMVHAKEYLLEILNKAQNRADTAQGRLNVQMTLASLYDALSEYDLTIQCYEQALGMVENNAYGNFDELRRADVKFSLAGVFRIKGERDQALQYFNEALEIRTRLLPEGHADIAAVWNGLANVYQGNDEFGLALDSYAQIVRMYENPDDAEQLHVVAIVMANMASVYLGLGDLDLAWDNSNGALRILKPRNDKAIIASTLSSMAGVLVRRKNFLGALKLYEEALEIQRRTLNDSHIYIANTLSSMGVVYRNQDLLTKALVCYTESLRIFLDKLGDDCLEVAKVLHNIGNVYNDQGEFTFAMNCYRDALRIKKHATGEGSLILTSTLCCMAEVEEKMVEREDQAGGKLARCQKAITLLSEARDILIAKKPVEVADIDTSLARLRNLRSLVLSMVHH